MKTYCLPERIGSKISVIPHGNFISTYENRLSQSQARYQLGFGNQDFIFLYFGQIRPYKGVFQLIDAFQELDSMQARLLVVGRPANESIRIQLEERCRQNKHICTYLEFVPDEDVQLYTNAANVVVLPFQDILTSSTVVLAMSFGKAVITPRLGCVAEILDDQGGFLYDPVKEDGLLQAMRGALSADWAEIGQHNYERVKHFDWNEVARETHEVYRRCFA